MTEPGFRANGDPEPDDQGDQVAVVRTLLLAAGLQVPETDIVALSRTYPALRAGADRLYRNVFAEPGPSATGAERGEISGD